MTIRLNIPFSCVLSLIVALGLTSMCSFVRTFGLPNGLARRSLQTSTSLRISLWESDMTFNLEGDDDGKKKRDENGVQHKQAKQIEIIKYKRPVPRNELWCPFYFYLYQMHSYMHNPSTKALHMDDELKRMESKYHQLAGDDLPQIRFPLGHWDDNYTGDLVRPNEKVYEFVLRAYSKANLGEEAIKLAESVVDRYEKFNTSRRASTKMMTFVMKACISAGNMERAEYWLHRIEERYESTQSFSDFPGYYVYNPFIIGLKKMTDVSDRRMAKRSMEILEKIDMLCDSPEKYTLFPGRDLYIEVMKYQERGYKGSAGYFRIEKVLRQLQKNYLSTGNHSRLKPSIEALTPVFTAASNCYFPHNDKVIQMVNKLFDEFDELYLATGDPDFRPNATICNSLNSIYARMNRHKMNLTDFVDRTMFLIQRMEEYNVKFKDPRDKTSAINRILHAAETQMPDDPMDDPLRTRDIFVVALNIFKKFHEDSSIAIPPNEATYQIFLRACAKLPEGESRYKLAAKAFELCQQKGFVTADTVSKLNTADPTLSQDSTDSL